ncbi:hypothetical protein OG599_15100 [Streptomyces sp. NBC_01335]|uniref:hypothetical protein n=1 Tax=Streptomyces sp. NBC_01335 TaxID=2903828 RepID=UPI002E11792E|nr:hypothetical protein OG599_15100 [Streptomyces sp. NBC_01335]
MVDSSSDVQLLVNEAYNDIQELVDTNKVMVQDLDDMLTEVGAILNNNTQISGDWQGAWSETQTVVNSVIAAMNTDLQEGVKALREMVDTQIRGDVNAAGSFSR